MKFHRRLLLAAGLSTLLGAAGTLSPAPSLAGDVDPRPVVTGKVLELGCPRGLPIVLAAEGYDNLRVEIAWKQARFTRGSQPATRSDLRVGMKVSVYGTGCLKSRHFQASEIRILPAE